MTDALKIPAGYRLVPEKSELTGVVSFKITDEERLRLAVVRDTFNPPQWTQVMRWLINDPRVIAIMRERVDEATVHVTQERGRSSSGSGNASMI